MFQIYFIWGWSETVPDKDFVEVIGVDVIEPMGDNGVIKYEFSLN